MKLVYNYLIIYLIFLSCFSCKNKSGTVSKIDNLDKNRFEESVISLEKTECYEPCPSYTITVYGTGKAIYEGKKNVSKIGKYQKQLKTNEASKLFNAYECANFFDFQSEYINETQEDLPKTYVGFQHRGFKKKIIDQHDSPEELKHLEQLVEEIANNEEGWSKTE